MTVQMRELRAKDTFAVIRLAKKLGITNSIIGLLKQQEKASSLMTEQKTLLAKKVAWELVLQDNPGSPKAEQANRDINQANQRLNELAQILNDESFSLITELVELVIGNVDGVEEEVFKFLGDLCGKQKEEFQEVSLLDFVGVIKAFFEKPELQEVFKLFTSSKASEESTHSETSSTDVIQMPTA